MNRKGELDLVLEDYFLHSIQPPGFHLQEPIELVKLLERAVPIEMFQSNDTTIRTTYLDADLRIIETRGPRIGMVKSVFIRQPQMHTPPSTGENSWQDPGSSTPGGCGMWDSE